MFSLDLFLRKARRAAFSFCLAISSGSGRLGLGSRRALVSGGGRTTFAKTRPVDPVATLYTRQVRSATASSRLKCVDESQLRVRRANSGSKALSSASKSVDEKSSWHFSSGAMVPVLAWHRRGSSSYKLEDEFSEESVPGIWSGLCI